MADFVSMGSFSKVITDISNSTLTEQRKAFLLAEIEAISKLPPRESLKDEVDGYHFMWSEGVEVEINDQHWGKALIYNGCHIDIRRIKFLEDKKAIAAFQEMGLVCSS